MQRITPNIWFNENAAEAADFYLDCFDDATIIETHHYPTEGLLDFQRPFAGKVLTVDLTIAGLNFTFINAGPEFRPNPSISFMVTFDPSRDDRAAAKLDELWQRLNEGGTVRMALEEYFFSPRYGWVEDKFGVNWQLILAGPDDPAVPTVIPALNFAGPATNHAREAISYYTSLFEGSAAISAFPYPEDTGPAHAGSLMYADFDLAHQRFVAMDAGEEHHFTFNEGVSLSVECSDQAEIDRLWSALSHDPSAEQCGWCRDEFGVSWQIVPSNMAELMQRPGAYERLMEMKKIEIAGF